MPGSFPAYSRTLDRVDITTGGGADGEGELVPSPLSLTPPTILPLCWQATHTPLPAPPPPGRGPCLRYLVGSRIRGGAGGKPYPALLQDLPMLWTVWISPRGVGLTGRGNLFPLPCLPHSNHLTSRQHPHPARACGAPPPPRRGRGQCVAISGEQPYPALLRDLPMLWTVWISPRGEAARGYLTSRRPRLRRSSPSRGWPGAVPGCCRRGVVLKRDMSPATGRRSSPDPS